MERLQKVLAEAGVASRRKCEEYITAGRVSVNGEPVTTLGAKVNPHVDEITVDGRPVNAQNKLYVMLNKPKGVITSATDPEGRKIVADYLKGIEERVYPVGRLDYDTEGLLLLTNDGEFANLMTHPKHHVPRTYHATVKGQPHGSLLEKLASGIKLEDGMTAPAEVDYFDVNPEKNETIVSITLYEGRNRQVRRMFDAISFPVIKLKRVQFGPLGLTGLPRGKYRLLKAADVKELIDSAYKATGTRPAAAVKERTEGGSAVSSRAAKPGSGKSAVRPGAKAGAATRSSERQGARSTADQPQSAAPRNGRRGAASVATDTRARQGGAGKPRTAAAASAATSRPGTAAESGAAGGFAGKRSGGRTGTGGSSRAAAATRGRAVGEAREPYAPAREQGAPAKRGAKPGRSGSAAEGTRRGGEANGRAAGGSRQAGARSASPGFSAGGRPAGARSSKPTGTGARSTGTRTAGADRGSRSAGGPAARGGSKASRPGSRRNAPRA